MATLAIRVLNLHAMAAPPGVGVICFHHKASTAKANIEKTHRIAHTGVRRLFQ